MRDAGGAAHIQSAKLRPALGPYQVSQRHGGVLGDDPCLDACRIARHASSYSQGDFLGSTSPKAFLRPDRGSPRPSRAGSVKAGFDDGVP